VGSGPRIASPWRPRADSRLTHRPVVQYYLGALPSYDSVKAGSAVERKNILRRLYVMTRTTIFRCKGNAALEKSVRARAPLF
jgi:hypothetical protein